MLVTPGNSTGVLHYGSDPLLGYHLTTAYLPLQTDASKASKAKTSGYQKLVEVARNQFATWCNALRGKRKNTVVRLLLSDALRACQQLLSDGVNTDALSASDGPRRFNVIDTSNLADHLGSLNVLIATIPLLQSSNNALVYTESLVKQETDLKSTMSNMLCGDFVTMCLVLGVYSVETWSNASAVAPEEAMLNTILASMPSNVASPQSPKSGQDYIRLAWRTMGIDQDQRRSLRMSVDAEPLAQLLFSIYQNMFADEDMAQSFARLANVVGAQSVTLSQPVYHHGSFVAVVVFLRERIDSDWSKTLDRLLGLIMSDMTIMLTGTFYQELMLYMHVGGLYSTKEILDPVKTPGVSTHHMTKQQREDSSGLTCVSLTIPRAKLAAFNEMDSRPNEVGTPALHAVIGSSSTYSGRPWENAFSAVRVIFGKLQDHSKSAAISEDAHIVVDESGWIGKSDLVASFFVPTWLLLLEPGNATISVRLSSVLVRSKFWISKLGPSLVIHQAREGDRSSVCLSKRPPEVSVSGPGSFSMGALGPNSIVPIQAPANGSDLVAELNAESSIKSLSQRWVLQSDSALASLRSGMTVATKVEGPFQIRIYIGRGAQAPQQAVTFPLPIGNNQYKTRVARQSGYVEIVLPISTSPSPSRPEADQLLTMFAFGTTPLLWCMPRLDLELQPSIVPSKDLQWLTTHVSIQMSGAERALRDKYLGSPLDCPSPRINFKDSIFSMFMHFTGVQGGKADIFGLSLPEQGGIHILIFVSKLRLDLGNHTAMLDTSVLPLSTRVMTVLGSFLGNLAPEKICQIKVDLEELKLWHRMLQIYAERCRTWSHNKSCEYRTASFHQRAWDQAQDPLCSCGRGKIEESAGKGLKNWNVAKKYAVRAAISPLYAVPYVDQLYTPEVRSSKICASCGTTESNRKPLLACGKCKTVHYCSKDCQKAHWTAHKHICKKTSS